MRTTVCWAGVLTIGLLSLSATTPARAEDAIDVVNGQLVVPDGVGLPRYETEAERRLRATMEEPPRPRAATPPPSGPIHCVAEYEPMEGILVSWGSTTSWPSAWRTLLTQMGGHITTTGNAIYYVLVRDAAAQTQAQTALAGQGANMSRVQFITRFTDSIWIRDYGPRYIYEGQCRAIIDHKYNRPTRPNDNTVPAFFAGHKKHALYELQNLYGLNQLVHGGGNFHLDALGRGYATRLIANENLDLTEPQIVDIWYRYQNLQTAILDPFPTSVDATQHIDMWMQVTGDNSVVISDWPLNSGSTQDVICDNTAAWMSGLGYTVTRVPALSVGGTHYTYTNVVMCNNLVLIPSYTNATVSPYNATALAAWQSALPGKTIVQLNSQGIVTSAGVMHCIVMHVPAHLGGANPTAYLVNLRGGEVLSTGSNVTIRWISDDDVGTTTADILLSRDGGATWPTVIASAIPDNGSFAWTVPGPCSSKARLRVVVRDANGNTGFDASTSNIRIVGSPCPGDMNCDGQLDANDVPPFVLALCDPAGYATAYPACTIANGDMDGNTLVNGGDVQAFVGAVMQP